jgi:hypothetical protein
MKAAAALIAVSLAVGQATALRFRSGIEVATVPAAGAGRRWRAHDRSPAEEREGDDHRAPGLHEVAHSPPTWYPRFYGRQRAAARKETA